MKITIANAAYGGYGVGRLDGKTIFVDYAVPGDEVEIEIYDDRKNYSFASCKEVISPSSKRITSPCPNFGICGGCSYLNISYSDEIEFKKNILLDQLRRISSISPVNEINIITDNRYNYRSHSSVKSNGNCYGFYGKNTNTIIPFPERGCLLISDNLTKGLKHFNFNDSVKEIKIAEDWNGNFYSDQQDEVLIEEKTGDYYYRRSINSFFQSNRFLRKQMSDLVCSYSELNADDEFADICAGCGFFTIPLSKLARRGTGFDIDKKSIFHAKANAALNKCSNINFFSLSESEINPSRLNPKTVVIDPPRAGISKRGRKTINAINPGIIVYVSCNPSTYSRDIIDFLKNGFELTDITMIDMFPCTHHIEIVSKLVKCHR